MATKLLKSSKKRSSSKKKSGKVFISLIIIILIAALGWYFISPVLSSKNDQKHETKPDKAAVETSAGNTTTAEPTKVEKPAVSMKIEGAWSNADGFLIMKDGNYRIDFNNVDNNAKPIIGTFSVDGNIATFINKKDPCEGAKGLYEVSRNGKNIVLKCQDDNCSRRKNVLGNNWEWLDADLNEVSFDE